MGEAPETHQNIGLNVPDKGKEEKEVTREEALKRWSEEVGTKKPSEIIGGLMAGGAQVVGNYMLPTSMKAESIWKPGCYTSGNGREMISFCSDFPPGVAPVFGQETLKAGLEKVLLPKQREENFFGVPEDDQLCLIPYLRFNPNGGVDSEKSSILMLYKHQVDDLKKALEKAER